MRERVSGNRMSIFIIIASCFLFSCGKDTVFNKYQSVQNGTWKKQDSYFFNFAIYDNSAVYNVSLQLRNNNMYPYQNIWIICEETLPSNTSAKDTIEHLLADDFGKWTGSGITLFQSSIPLKSLYHFPDTGNYTIIIQHGMRDDNLIGIEDIGLFIEKAK